MLQSTSVLAQNEPLETIIYASETKVPVSEYIYGQFIEHIADIINDGLWAEMLDDRKFYYPVLEKQPEQQGFRVMQRWLSVGPIDAINMSEKHAYTGKLSPEILLSSSEYRGIIQGGLAVEEGQSYNGRIVIKAEYDLNLNIFLSTESGIDKETIAISAGDYQTYEFSITAGTDDTDARLRISAKGEGSLWIGAVSLMPADNLEGFRPEIITLLKSLNSGVYRFPGGNFVSAHE